MRPPPRTALLLAALGRASRRLADAAAVLSTAEETRLLAHASIARSRRLLDQVEQARSAESDECYQYHDGYSHQHAPRRGRHRRPSEDH